MPLLRRAQQMTGSELLVLLNNLTTITTSVRAIVTALTESQHSVPPELARKIDLKYDTLAAELEQVANKLRSVSRG